MGSDSAVSVTAGSGTNIDAFQLAGGDYQQVTREARATAVGALNDWTISATASTGQIAADANRVGLLIVVRPDATGRVYFRFDNTAPTTGSYHWFLDPGTEWEVPDFLVQLPVSMLGVTAAGHVLSTLGTCS